MKRTSVLFVCMGNICRSPLAEGILSHLAKTNGVENELTIDSAGTGGWHAGNPPDQRSIAIARQHDIDISPQSARQISADDFENFDLILAMDEDNLARLKAACPAEFRDRLYLFGSYTLGQRVNVPDPYYGGEDGFVTVYNMLFAGCSSLLEKMLAERAS